MRYNYITIEGCIGAGKTTLASKIAEDYGAKLILEQFEENAFLPKFYKDPEHYAFPLEMSFLAERYRQLRELLSHGDLFASFTIGLNAIRRAGSFDACFLLPGDMPAVEPEVLKSLMHEMEKGGWDVVFPSTGTKRLHPPLIHARLFDALIAYSGDDGLRGAFRALNAKIGYVVTQNTGCRLDVDTPEDYERVQRYLEKKHTMEDGA